MARKLGEIVSVNLENEIPALMFRKSVVVSYTWREICSLINDAGIILDDYEEVLRALTRAENTGDIKKSVKNGEISFAVTLPFIQKMTKTTAAIYNH